jgi:hypothetical protein
MGAFSPLRYCAYSIRRPPNPNIRYRETSTHKRPVGSVRCEAIASMLNAIYVPQAAVIVECATELIVIHSLAPLSHRELHALRISKALPLRSLREHPTLVRHKTSFVVSVRAFNCRVAVIASKRPILPVDFRTCYIPAAIIVIARGASD